METLDEKTERQISGGDTGAEVSIQFLRDAKGYLAPGGVIYLLTSSESEASVLEFAGGLYDLEKVGEKRLVYEVLTVWKLMVRG